MATEEEFVAPSIAAAVDVPEDADDLRGFHFRKLLGNRWTWGIVGGLAVVATVLTALYAKGVPPELAIVAVLLVSLLVLFAIADSRSADSFFSAYAEANGMTLMDGRMRLPEATPLLRKGDDRYADRLLEGPLAGQVEGKLATYTYEEKSYDSDGEDTNKYSYTVAIASVPECVSLVPELYCQHKSGLRALEKFEDVFRGSKKRVKLESEQLDRKYEIFANESQDATWLRRLFSPTFIVWLIESAPDKFAFELVDGTLCCYVHGHQENREALDGMRVATAAVATRLKDEALE
jgi:hypothetical protein